MMIGWLLTMAEPIKTISNKFAILRFKKGRACQISGPTSVVKNSIKLTPCQINLEKIYILFTVNTFEHFLLALYVVLMVYAKN